MTTEAQANTKPAPIRLRVGKGFLKSHFGEKPFMHCMIELLKNIRDWRATRGWIDTTVRSWLDIFDDGVGMNEANRNAFFSIAETESTASANQSGQFCTGAKMMFYSFATVVEVTTISADEPNWVYRFSCTLDQHEELVFRGGTLDPERLPKNDQSWPYEQKYGAKTGTMIRFRFATPTSRSIYRGDHLANELSARLPMRFANIVSVNGSMIPAKQIVGTSYEVTDNTVPDVGDVTFELYRSKDRRREEELRLTSSEIGEVPMRTFIKLLGEHESGIPEIYRVSDVNGVISAAVLRPYNQEVRNTLGAKLVDDPRILQLVTILRKHAPAIQRALQITLKSAEDSGDDAERDQIRGVATLFNKAFGNNRSSPPDQAGANGNGNGPPPPPTDEPKGSPMSLDHRKELEVGEEVEMVLSFRPDLRDKFSLDDVQWTLDQAGGPVRLTRRGLHLTAKTIGSAHVRADVPNTLYKALARYEVVQERKLRLSVSYTQIQAGVTLPVFAHNSDKVKGELKWKLSGVGNMQVNGARAEFTSTDTGSATIEVWDSRHPTTRSVANISVVANTTKQDFICVDGVWFSIDVFDSNADSFRKPITMIRSNSAVHIMKVNRSAPSYRQARGMGSMADFLLFAIASEFAFFKRFGLDTDDEDRDMLDASTFPAYIEQMQQDQYRILETIQVGRN